MIRVLAVHGVGPQSEAALKREVEGVLQSVGANAELGALVWADWKRSPVRDETVRGHVQDFVRAVTGTALVEQRLGLGDGDHRRRGTRGGRLFQVAVGACVGLGPPAVAMILLTEFCLASLRKGYSPDPITPLLVGLATVVLAAAPLALTGVWAATRRRSLAPLYRSGRTLTLLTLAPLLGAGLAVMVWKWQALRNIFAECTMTMVVALSGLFCYMALPMLILDRELLAAFFWMFLSQVAGPYALLAAVALPVSAFLALFVRIAPFLAEVCLDVVRYLGDDKYRADLHDLLRPHLRPTADCDTLVLVGHSLGSVVCLDVLLNDPIIPSPRRVVLVTCGSPIRRWFMRFFPGVLFPDSVEACAAELAARYGGRFAWVNVYRNSDPVGGRFTQHSTAYFSEEDISGGETWLKAHFGYWASERLGQKVHARVTSVLTSGTAAPNPPAPAPSADARIPGVGGATEAPFGSESVRRFVTPLYVVATVLVLTTYLIATDSTGLRERREALASLRARGKPVEAEVTFWSMSGTSPKNPWYEEGFLVRFPVAPDFKREFPRDLSEPRSPVSDRTFVDYRALRNHVETKGEGPGGNITRSTVQGVRVDYDPADPELFMFADYTTDIGILEWVWWLLKRAVVYVVCLVAAGVAAYFALWASFRVYRLFCG